MARPLWSDAGTDPAAIADHLDRLAGTATQLRFEPRPLPDGIDAKVLHRAALVRARRQLTQRHGERDRILAEEVRAIDDLVRTANLLVERLREWYALHAPEATRLTPDAKELARLVAEHGDRKPLLTALDHAELAAASLGTQLDDADIAVLQGFAGALRAVHESWAALEARVTQLMDEVAPNVASVAGPIIGARLIALAGSLQKLATVPTGTVQLYGAETALFRHIKEGTKPPKHGIIFQHPLLHAAPPWQRGALARAMAQQLSLGAKADAFTGNDLRVALKEALDADVARIQRERAKPPARAAHTTGRPGGPGPRFGKPGGRSDDRRGPAGGRRSGPGGRDDRRGPGGGQGGRSDDRRAPGRSDDRRGPGGRGPGGKEPARSDDRRGPKPKRKQKFSQGPAKPPGGGRGGRA